MCVRDCGKGSFKVLADGETPLEHLPSGPLLTVSTAANTFAKLNDKYKRIVEL